MTLFSSAADIPPCQVPLAPARVVSMGFTADDESQRMKAFFERGNAFTLKKLQEKFRK